MNLLQSKINSISKYHSLLPELLEAQARETPSATAVTEDNTQLTFAELNGRANQLARLLQKQGVGVETLCRRLPGAIGGDGGGAIGCAEGRCSLRTH